jgi:hypothetical protein
LNGLGDRSDSAATAAAILPVSTRRAKTVLVTVIASESGRDTPGLENSMTYVPTVCMSSEEAGS